MYHDLCKESLVPLAPAQPLKRSLDEANDRHWHLHIFFYIMTGLDQTKKMMELVS